MTRSDARESWIPDDAIEEIAEIFARGWARTRVAGAGSKILDDQLALPANHEPTCDTAGNDRGPTKEVA